MQLHREPGPPPTLSPTPDPAHRPAAPGHLPLQGRRLEAQGGLGCVACFRGYLPDPAKPSAVGWNVCPELRAEVVTLTARKGSG